VEEDVGRRVAGRRYPLPDPNGYSDCKAVLVIRQDLDDDSKEAIAALHGLGMIHLAQRPEKDVRVTDMEYRVGAAAALAAPTRTAWSASSPSASASRSMATFSRFLSVWKANQRTNSAHPSTCTSMGRSTPASGFARICRIKSIPPCSPTWSSKIPPAESARRAAWVEFAAIRP
jgi:hypothetical protein